ncbi:hypothetical protein KJ059_01745 [Myxococcota bacterium]|nr:hypothetical protein [Myxococcota bacterium]
MKSLAHRFAEPVVIAASLYRELLASALHLLPRRQERGRVRFVNFPLRES